jgi:peptidoglycan/xylan/chitin deacetylase (PgdA/CDA1 family)
MLKEPDRFGYSALSRRPDFTWPGGKRLALYVALNVEHFPWGRNSGPDLDRPTLPWGQRSWLWREYGNRVGAWRLMDLFDELALPVGVIANTAIYDHCPEVLEAHVKRGDELIAHGRNQVERQIEMTIEQEREMVQEVTRTFTERNGVKPVGWMSPYLTPSDHTTDLLAESGYQYCMDWGLCDEQPFHVKAATGSVLAMPYPIELNDQPAVVYRGNTGADYAEMLVDNFDELLRSSKDTSLVFAISIHTFVVGQPYRLARLRRALQHMLSHRDDIWVAMPKDIAAHYSALPADRQLHPR